MLWTAGGCVAVAVALAVGAGSTAVAGVAGSAATRESDDVRDGTDAPLLGSDLERATAAALAHTGGGTVTDTETGDDGAAYGVEIRKPDGTEVEVGLDANFAVTSEEVDD